MTTLGFLLLLALTQFCDGRATPPAPNRNLWAEFNVPQPPPEFWTQEKFHVSDPEGEKLWTVGDIEYTPQTLKQIKHGLSEKQWRWPNGLIPILIDPFWNQEAQQRIVQGMVMIQEATCIRFQNYSENFHEHYVHIMPAEEGFGCRALVGRQQDSPSQWIKLEPNWHCVSPGTVAHELIHSIGFFHEQQRPDRDIFITINWENIPEKAYIDFAKVVGLNLFAPYDYSSIMHYPSWAWAIDTNQPAMISKTSIPINGQSEYLTRLDAMKINNMYADIC